jgi:ribosomal protein S12 methylthiotransferase
MKRKITGDEIRKLLDTIRNKVPDIAIRTSMIVGFPNETKKQFQQLRNFLEESQLDRVGVFTYSHEEDTPAYKLKETVSEREKEKRKEELMFLQQDISLSKNKQKIGKKLKVLIDTEEQEQYIGRTEFDSPEIDNTVIIPKNTVCHADTETSSAFSASPENKEIANQTRNDECVKIGNFYDVTVSAADCFDLIGHIEKQ